MQAIQERALPAVVAPQLPAEAAQFGIDQAGWDVLRQHLYPAARSTDTIMLLLKICHARKLNVMRKPYHIVPTWDEKKGEFVDTIWEGINNVLTTASRTGEWAGKDAAVYGPEKEFVFTNSKTKQKVTLIAPEWATTTIYKLVNGVKEPFTCNPVYFKEAVALKHGVPNSMWTKRPYGQLGKCADAAALRLAFPEEAGSDPTAEEMEDQVLVDTADAVTPVTAAKNRAMALAQDRVAEAAEQNGQDVVDAEAEDVEPTQEERLMASAEVAEQRGMPEAAQVLRQEAEGLERGISNKQAIELMAALKPKGWQTGQLFDLMEKTPFSVNRQSWSKDITQDQYRAILDWVKNHGPDESYTGEQAA